VPAVIALLRALFFDFNLDEVMDNSSGYLNVSLYGVYLFVAIFIILSLFLAILAEAHMKIRQQRRDEARTTPRREPHHAASPRCLRFRGTPLAPRAIHSRAAHPHRA
jgi:uncharacterized membrane protein